MTWDTGTAALVEAFQSSKLSRRQFVRRLAAAGLSTGAIAAFLSACGGAPDATAPTGGGQSSSGAAPAGTPTAVAAIPTAAVVTAGAASGAVPLKAPEPNPKRGGTLRFAFGATTANYDMQQGANSNVLCQLYNNLIRLNIVDGLRTIVPDVAEKWDMAPDGLSYTFKLRSGVQFHDGTPLTADDVAATYNRMIFPPQGIVSSLKDHYSSVSGIEALDPLTVKFTLKQPTSDFLLTLTEITNAIYSKKTLEANKNDLRTVVAPGTGPFMYKSYQDSEKWTLVKNPNYWNKELPYVDSLEFLHVPAWPDRGTAVLTGQADLSWNVSGDTWDEGAKRKDIINTYRVAAFNGPQVVLNTKQKPFDDPRVRRALHLALSRQTVIDAYKSQEQVVLTRWVQHGSEFATPTAELVKLPGYRPDKTQDIIDAKKLLADAGFPNGIQGVDFLCASVAPHATILAPSVQDQLKQALNIDLNIRVMERALLVDAERKGQFTLVLDTPGGTNADFSPVANSYFKTGGAQNFGGYSNPKFDDLLKQADQALDRNKQAELLNQLQDLLDQDPPWLWIGYEDHMLMARSYVKGLALEKRLVSEWGRVDTAWLDK